MSYVTECLADNPVAFWSMVGGPLFASLGTDTAALTVVGRPVLNAVPLNADQGRNPEMWASTDVFLGPATASACMVGSGGAITLEAWVKRTTAQDYGGIIGKGNADNSQHEFAFFFTPSLVFNISTIDGAYVGGIGSGTTLDFDGKAHHLVAVFDFDPPLMALYVDGYGVAGQSGTSYAVVPNIGTAPLTIGNTAGSGPPAMQGNIGWVAIYPTALSSDRILAHYTAGSRPSAQGYRGRSGAYLTSVTATATSGRSRLGSGYALSYPETTATGQRRRQEGEVDVTAVGARQRRSSTYVVSYPVATAAGTRMRQSSTYVITYPQSTATGDRLRDGWDDGMVIYPMVMTASGSRRRVAQAFPLPTLFARRRRSGAATPVTLKHISATGHRTRGGFPLFRSGSVRWKLFDPVEGTQFVFSINPNAGGSPPVTQPLTNKPTTAPDGTTLVFQGLPGVGLGEFSGVVRDAASYQGLVTWTAKPRVLALIDDLGRVSWIVFTQFTAQRDPRRTARDRYTYTCRYEVVG